MRPAILAFLLSACGGAPFSAVAEDSGQSDDAATPLPETSEAGEDVRIAFHPDGGTQDASPAQEASTCTPFTNVYSCGLTSATIYAPAELCQLPPDGTNMGKAYIVPDACRCQETYTCECLQAHAILCDGGCSQPYPSTLLLRCY